MERAKLLKQRMGQLLEERVMIGSLPWTAVCLDLLGLVTVKAMVNKRSWMKVWPLLLMCQMSGAIHLEVMHDYSTVAFLLQWWRFIAVHGCPAVVVSDRGSQLTSKENEANMDWRSIEESGTSNETGWDFMPVGCQYRNRLCEWRVAIIKKTLSHSLTNAVLMEKPILSYAKLRLS